MRSRQRLRMHQQKKSSTTASKPTTATMPVATEKTRRRVKRNRQLQHEKGLHVQLQHEKVKITPLEMHFLIQ